MKKGEFKTIECLRCKEPFKVNCWQQSKKYCSDSCRGKIHRINYIRKKTNNKTYITGDKLTMEAVKMIEFQKQKFSTLTKTKGELYWDK